VYFTLRASLRLFKLVPDQFVLRQRKVTKRLNFLEKFKTALAGPQDK